MPKVILFTVLAERLRVGELCSGVREQIMRLAQTTKIWAKEERVLSNMMLIKNGQWEIDQHYRRL